LPGRFADCEGSGKQELYLRPKTSAADAEDERPFLPLLRRRSVESPDGCLDFLASPHLRRCGGNLRQRGPRVHFLWEADVAGADEWVDFLTSRGFSVEKY